MKEEFIKNSPLFGELTDDERRAISKRMRLERYSANETLFVKGGESDALYLIKEGWVKLSDDTGASTIASLGPGSLLGETDFFMGRPYTMTAQSTGQVAVWTLDQSGMADLLAERSELGLYLGLAFGQGIAQFQPQLSEQLAGVHLFQELSPRERGILAKHFSPQRSPANETLYRSGDSPTGLYLIEKGAVRLLGDTDDDYAELLYGEVFGEMAVLSGKAHSETAQAASEIIVWHLSPASFEQLSHTNPSIKTSLTRNLRARLSGSDQAYATAVLRRISLFSALSREIITDVTRLLLLRHVPAGEIIYSQGDPGDALYIIDSGSIDIVSDAPGDPRAMRHRLTDGDFFGETALLTGKTRDFTARALTDTNLWCLYRTDFDNLLVKHPQISAALSQALRERLSSSENYSVEPHLQKIAELGGLSRTQLDELSALLQPRRYQGGSTIYFEGNPSEEMYFIERGQVEHWATTLQGPMLLDTLGAGDYFGEIALLSGRVHPSTAYAIVETDVWALTKADFDHFLKRYPNLGVVLSRILSERMGETMQRLRGSAPQRGLPAPGGTPPASRPVPRHGSQPQPPAGRGPSLGPSAPGRPASRPFTVMPPVPVRPVSPPPSKPRAALPAQTHPAPHPSSGQPPPHAPHSRPTTPVPPQPGPGAGPVHSQHTQGMPPVNRGPVHSQPTQGVPPVNRGPVHSQPTRGLPPVSSAGPQPVPPKAKPGRKPRRRVKKQKPQPQSPAAVPMPAARANPPQAPARAGASSQAEHVQPTAAEKATPAGPSQPQPAARASRSGRAIASRSRRRASKAEQRAPGRALALPAPRSVSNKRLQRHRNSISVWFAKRSLGAKLRLLAICIALVWLCGIMAPSLIINALASTFADEGALPGDSRSPMQKISEDGAVGAVAVLPFVETATPTPSNTPTPTQTSTQTPTPTNTPIPTSTHTPTVTPTPTDTPTPVFTPTPTDTPTPRATVTPRPPAVPTDTPTPSPTPTPDVDFRVKSMRQLTPCENRGKHHIFIKVEDVNGQGINNVPVKVEWASGQDGHAVVNTETKTDLKGSLDPGRIDFAMFKGSYTVEVMGGTSEVAGPVTPDFGKDEACGEDATANSLYHISFEVIFQRTF